MGKVKKIVNGTVVEVDEVQDPVVKTIENGVVVEKPLSQVKKKELTGVSATGSATVGTGGTVGSSAPPSEEKVTEDVTFFSPLSMGDGEAAKVGTLPIGSGLSDFPKKAISPSPVKEYKPEFLSQYNADFEKRIGQPELSLGSDLPQIKTQTEKQKYIDNRDREESIYKSVDNIYGWDGSLKDFENLKSKSPKVFNEVKEDLGITRSPETTAGEKYKDDNFVWDVYSDYKQKATESKMAMSRKRRGDIDQSINENLKGVSEFTGQEYAPPKSLEEAEKIINDIESKKAYILMTQDLSNSGPIGRLKEAELANQQIAKGEKIMPALTNLVSGFLFEQESKINPNLTPFELGKKIFKVTNPQEYELYELAGGDKPYGQMFRGMSETPKSADRINRYITQLGINAFQLYGNKAAVEKADEENSTLKWRFTLPIEEETKHMIAARLKEMGVPSKVAPQELIDQIASELPEINKQTWFEKNKPENNVSLPNTGFWNSAKSSYFNTVEDATKSLLGWMMPNRNRERALDVLKGQTSSNIIGENPESIQRLNALKEKERQEPLSEEEKQEKTELEKYTDIRTGWQRFKDLSGGGVGQFAGFGTISAFTGGLNSAKTIPGAVRSLISPSAGKGGMLAAGYLMSREANARDAVQMFPGENDGIKRFIYGEAASAIDTYIERLFPEEKFLSGVIKSDLVKLIPSLTQKNLRKELSEGFAKKLAKSFVTKLAEQQKTPIQEGLEEGAAAYFKDVFKGTLNPEYDANPITFDEILNTATQAYLSSQFLGVPKGIFAQPNKSVPLNAVWDAASDENAYYDVKSQILKMRQSDELTQDEANERISLLNTARKNWEDNPILSGGIGNLSLPKKQNYLGRLMNEAVLQKKADAATDENVKATLNKEISESKKARKAIYDGETFVTEQNDEVSISDLTPQQVILQQAQEGKLGAYSEMVQQNPDLANDVLIDYAKQKYGISDDAKDLEGGGRALPSKEVDEAVTKMFPDKEALVADMKGKASVSKVNQIARDAGEQIMPILQRINDADYINEGELNQAADRLYEIMDEVEKSDMTKEQKQSSLNLIEPIINKLEGYEFRTTTETGTTTETKANVVPRKTAEKAKKPALEQSEGTAVSVTGPSGTEVTGILRIENGKYVVINESGNKEDVLGEKAITDRDLSLPDQEEMENPIEFDDDGNVQSVTFKTKDGTLIKINTPEKALDLAIQLRAEMIGEVSQPDFDIVYEEVKKPYTKEVLVAEKQNVSEASTPKEEVTKPVSEVKTETNENTKDSNIINEQVKAEKESREQEKTDTDSAAAEQVEIFEAIDKAARSKKSQKAKDEAAGRAAVEFGEEGARALAIQRNFDDIVKQLKESGKLKVVC